MSNKKAVIYARVSTEEQANQGYSIKAQRDMLYQFAKQRNIDIIDEYIDEGKSGKSISGRPQMQKLLKDIEKGHFNIVLIYKLDRLARSTKDSLEISDRLARHNIQLMSYSENIDTSSPGGKMFFTVMSSVAEMERGQIVERVKMGMNQRAKQGKWNGGICFGYNVVDKELTINQEEARIVKEIFELADKGYGYKKIVGILNEKGYKTKKGKKFSTNSLKTILDNPIYIGKIRFNQHENWSDKRRKGKSKDPIIVDGTHQPIISKDLWYRVQQKRKSRSFRPAQSSKPYFLSRLIRCPQCGHGMVSGKSRRDGKSYRYYHCGQFHNKGSAVCSPNSINADRAEQQVMEELKRLVTEPYFIEKLVTKMNENRLEAEKPLVEEKKRLQSKIQKTKKNIDTITNKLMDDPDLMDIFANKLKEQKMERMQLEEKLQTVQHQLENMNKEPIDAKALRHLLENLEQILDKASVEEKKELLSLIVKDIQITKNPVSRRIGRQIKQINLVFDFTIDALQGHTGELLSRMINLDFISSVDTSFIDQLEPSEKIYRDALASLSILPLFMIRFSVTYQNKIHLI
jgi:site-specific DNA recombinase